MPTQLPAVSRSEPIVPEVVLDRSRRAGDPRAELDQLHRLAAWMDSAIQIPGTSVRVGVDALLGLLPGVGDVASAMISLHILQTAQRHGVSRLTLSRMAANLVMDSMCGAVPVAGDVFDVFWRANSKNVALLKRHFDADPASRRSVQRSDKLFFGFVVAALLLTLVGSVTLTWVAASWLWSFVRGTG
jgi:hypothetical protein